MKTKTNLVIIISLVVGMLSFANAEVKNYYIIKEKKWKKYWEKKVYG